MRISTYLYDDKGKVAEELKVGGIDRLVFGYSTSTTYLTDYSGANGSAVQRYYSFKNIRGVARPTTVSKPCSLCGTTQKSSAYDTTGNTTKTIGHDGLVTFYVYDAKGRETERAVFPASYQSATTRPALSAAQSVTSTAWHSTFNLPLQIGSPRQAEGFTYDAKGNLTLHADVETTDATGAAKLNGVRIDSTRKRTHWTYNALSLPTTIRQTIGGDGNGVGAVETGRWTYAYGADGGLAKVTDVQSGQSGVFTSDAAGRITRIDASNGAVASFLPNPRGRMIKAVTPSLTTDFSIDARGLTNEIRFSDGRWIKYTHNAAHRLIQIVDNTGHVEQYAGVEPRWFIDEKTIRTAAAWLYLGGQRLSSLLVPAAHAAVPAVVIPAGVVLGLFVIVDTARRSGSSGQGAGRCCGQDAPSSSSGEGGAAPSWAQQIAILLSGETAQPTATPAPVYDKAGLLVSPQACMPPPGNCDPNKHRQLQDDVDAKCGGPRRCTGSMTKPQLLSSLELFQACGTARDRINKTCFAGGDKGHRDQAIGEWQGVAQCETFLNRLP